MDSLAQYENPTVRHNHIIQKLTSLNTIFKELKLIKELQNTSEVRQNLS